LGARHAQDRQAAEMRGAKDVVATARDLLSIRLLGPLYRLQRLARPSCRAAVRAFQEGILFRAETASWSEGQKREWILHRLRDCVRRAWNDTAYYRTLFARIGFDPRSDFGFDDFARLPALEREDIHRAGTALVSRSVPASELRRDATGGSTGKPAEVWLGPEERGWRESGSEYSMTRIGVPKGSRVGFLWGHHLDPVASDRLTDRLRDFVENIRWFDCFRLSPTRLAQYHTELERWRPRCVVAYAGALGALAEEVRDRGWCPSYPTHCFVTGAEKLMPDHRRAIQAVFGRPVHERYGGRDVGLIAFQVDVARSLDYEVDWSNVLIEPETPTPSSSILVTKLHGDGMPMLRYRVGDIGHFPGGSGPGHPTFVLHEVLGHEIERIWLPDGRWIHGIQIRHLMKDHPIREFQLVQRADFSVVVLVVPRNGFTQQNRTAIADILEANLPRLNPGVQIVDAIPRTAADKLQPVISEVDAHRRGVTP